MTADDLLLATPSPGTLAGRLRAVGLAPDGVTAVDEVVDVRETADAEDARDFDHLMAEHRAAVEEIRRLRDALAGLARAMRYDPCLNETADDDPCDCCIVASDLARVWADGLVEVRP